MTVPGFLLTEDAMMRNPVLNTTSQLRAAIRTLAQNSIFSVQFVKRTTGETRDMVCRLGAANKVKGEAGNGPAYDPVEKGLLPVWDMQANGFRSIPLDNIIRIKIKGTEYHGPAYTKPLS